MRQPIRLALFQERGHAFAALFRCADMRDTLDAKVAEIVKALVNNSPNAVRQAKALVRDVAGQTVDDALLGDTAERIAHIRASEQGREGVASFLEKRKPNWLTH